MYGINGGANLSGGAIDFSGKNPSVIVPFNSEAWILRAFYTDKANRLIEELIGKYKSFKSNGNEEKPIKIIVQAVMMAGMLQAEW